MVLDEIGQFLVINVETTQGAYYVGLLFITNQLQMISLYRSPFKNASTRTFQCRLIQVLQIQAIATNQLIACPNPVQHSGCRHATSARCDDHIACGNRLRVSCGSCQCLTNGSFQRRTGQVQRNMWTIGAVFDPFRNVGTAVYRRKFKFRSNSSRYVLELGRVCVFDEELIDTGFECGTKLRLSAFGEDEACEWI